MWHNKDMKSLFLVWNDFVWQIILFFIEMETSCVNPWKLKMNEYRDLILFWTKVNGFGLGLVVGFSVLSYMAIIQQNREDDSNKLLWSSEQQMKVNWIYVNGIPLRI